MKLMTSQSLPPSSASSHHPLVVDDCSLHFCLSNEQWIHRWVGYEISARSVFLPVWKMSKWKFPPLKYFPFHRIQKIAVKFHRSFECNLIPATSYRGDKRVHFSNNQFMNGILTWFDCNSSFRNLRIILSDLRFHNTFQFVKYGASA